MYPISRFINIPPPVGEELFDADGQTDGKTEMTNLTLAFGNFANAPKSKLHSQVCDCPSEAGTDNRGRWGTRC